MNQGFLVFGIAGVRTEDITLSQNADARLAEFKPILAIILSWQIVTISLHRIPSTSTIDPFDYHTRNTLKPEVVAPKSFGTLAHIHPEGPDGMLLASPRVQKTQS